MAGTTTQNKGILAAAMLAVALVTAGCAQNTASYANKETVGTLGGAALGGWLGSKMADGRTQLATTAAGALVGALIGNQIGQGLDEVDQMKVREAQETAASAPVGQTITWSNPDTGRYGSVTATREGTSSSGAYCREFQHTIFVDGQAQDGYGTACRKPDGSWEMI